MFEKHQWSSVSNKGRKQRAKKRLVPEKHQWSSVSNEERQLQGEQAESKEKACT
jgi:hypothetical protein